MAERVAGKLESESAHQLRYFDRDEGSPSKRQGRVNGNLKTTIIGHVCLNVYGLVEGEEIEYCAEFLKLVIL